MITLILTLTIINTLILVFFALKWFNETYIISKREAYDIMADYFLQYHDKEGNELTHELAGGVGTPYYGFFQEQLEEGEEEENNE